MGPQDFTHFLAFIRRALSFGEADQLLRDIVFRYGSLPSFHLGAEAAEESKQCCEFVLHNLLNANLERFCSKSHGFDENNFFTEEERFSAKRKKAGV